LFYPFQRHYTGIKREGRGSIPITQHGLPAAYLVDVHVMRGEGKLRPRALAARSKKATP
jgi:hypothetical protein